MNFVKILNHNIIEFLELLPAKNDSKIDVAVWPCVSWFPKAYIVIKSDMIFLYYYTEKNNNKHVETFYIGLDAIIPTQ